MKRALHIGGLLACALTILACGDPQGVLIAPSPDTAWNSEAQVLQSITSMELLLDVEGGFASGASGDGAQLLDADGDGEDEILLSMDVAGRDQLPRIRLEEGERPEQPVALRLRGMDAQGQVVAYGGLEARPLFDGTDRINVPFDLARAAQPPFVTAVSPGAVPAGSSLAALAFFSSRPLDPASLDGRAHVILDVPGFFNQSEVDGSWSAEGDCPDGVEMWTFRPSDCWSISTGAATLTIRLDAGVLDLQGQELRDDEGQPGFSATEQLSLAMLGDCEPELGCSAQDPSDFRVDLRCELSSGLLEPAPCSSGPDSCLGSRSQYGIVAGEDDAQCQAYRPGTREVEGACVIMDAWPCQRQSDCRNFGAFECDFASSTCIPDTCTSGCTGADEFCVPDWGCQPGMGACLNSCAEYGSCADFGQRCLRRDDGLWSCR